MEVAVAAMVRLMVQMVQPILVEVEVVLETLLMVQVVQEAQALLLFQF